MRSPFHRACPLSALHFISTSFAPLRQIDHFLVLNQYTQCRLLLSVGIAPSPIFKVYAFCLNHQQLLLSLFLLTLPFFVSNCNNQKIRTTPQPLLSNPLGRQMCSANAFCCDCQRRNSAFFHNFKIIKKISLGGSPKISCPMVRKLFISPCVRSQVTEVTEGKTYSLGCCFKIPTLLCRDKRLKCFL